MKTYQIVCIDDDEQFLSSLENTLPDKVEALCSAFGCAFDFVSNPNEAFQVMASAPSRDLQPAMIISDQVMPGLSGIELIEKAKSIYPDAVCVLLTGHAGLESAKYAINRHLLDQYVSKPIADLQEFATLLANLLRGRYFNLEERERTVQLVRTVEQLQIANERIQAMKTAAEQVAMLSKNLKALDFDEVVNVITCEVPRLFGAEWSVMCLPKNGCPAATNHKVKCPCPEAVLVDRQDVVEALSTGQVHCGEIAEACRRLGAESLEVLVPLSFAAMPEQEGQPKAVEKAYLCMCHVAPAPRDEMGLIKYKAHLLQEILSTNLTNARLYQEARRQSQVDSLTGASTRRVLDARMEAEHERSARYGHAYCIAILDVDHFKRINDAHGHDVGDSILRQLADVLRAQIRTSDVLARYGGDEFVVLMPETDLDGARIAGERFRECTEALRLPNGDPLTVSIGLAEWSRAASENATDVLRRADAALYGAKREGRNRMQVAAAV